MNSPLAELSYRRAAVQNASPVALVVILYDLLIHDLRSALQAMQGGAIEDRSKYLKHGLLVLQVLENGLDMKNGGAAAENLAAFYTCVRKQILNAQFQRDPAILERQVALILDLRATWCTASASSVSEVAISPDISAAQRDRPDHPQAVHFSA